MAQKIIETHKLTKKYSNFTALNKVSLQLEETDIYGLIGRNGAGKTTLFKLIMGLTKPASGSLNILDSENINAARKKIGFMIGLSFFPYFTAYQNIEYYRRLKGVEDIKESERVLKLVGLFGEKKPFKSFSMGMKQRLGIANALLGNPPVIILDEPINGLDPEGIADIRVKIKELNKTGVTFIISSHVLSELDLVATKFGFIDRGVLLKEISYENLHRETQRILIIETDNAEKAANIIQENFNQPCEILDNKIILDSCLEISNKIAKILIENNLELFELKRRETTLEEYFINLIGGEK